MIDKNPQNDSKLMVNSNKIIAEILTNPLWLCDILEHVGFLQCVSFLDNKEGLEQLCSA